jgi:glutamate 5-kinase
MSKNESKNESGNENKPVAPPRADRDAVKRVRRVVIKVGSSLLSDRETGLARDKIADYSEQISRLQRAGLQIVLVSSGAVAEGCARLGLKTRPDTIHELQAAAAVGQMGLVQAYESTLATHGCHTAMVMLTHDDLANRQRYLNARAALNQLLKLNVVPVINENDTVATDEIRFGDNDTLAALVTNLIEAELLIILTDVDGLMDSDPRINSAAHRVSQASATDPALTALAGAGAGSFGRGGMVTKLSAGRLAARSGAHTVIASGRDQQVIERILGGEDVGTLLTAELSPMTARKRWIAGQLKAKGDVIVDQGAARALVEQGVSLLAVGITDVRGGFMRGDVVRLVDAQGKVLAQGLTNYNHVEIGLIKGKRSDEFASYLDAVGEPEIVHRDNLVVL